MMNRCTSTLSSREVMTYAALIAHPVILKPFPTRTSTGFLLYSNIAFIAAAASEPEANERGSSLISRRLHHRGLQSLFLTKRKELWLCANGKI